MKSSLKKLIDTVCGYSQITKYQIAEKMGMSAPTFSKRLQTGKFSIDDYRNLENAINELVSDNHVRIELTVTYEDGTTFQ